MSTILVRATYPNVSGMAADEYVNSFVFNAPSSTAAAVAAVKAWHDSVPTGGDGVANKDYLGGLVSRTVAGTLQAYDITGHLDGSPHGSPVSTTALDLPGTVPTKSLPEQLAIVVSYHADFTGTIEHGSAATLPSDEAAIDQGAPATHSGVTRPRSRLRGRLYFGPIDAGLTNALGSLTSGPINNLQAASNVLMTAGLGWCVWSRRSASVANIIGGWVDNECGVVRRRRLKTQTKTPWTGHP